jgi:hypothetical protein
MKMEYQNIFTRVQVHAPYDGVPLPKSDWWGRDGKPFFVYWFGKFGDAQVGPIYLGGLGVASIICFFVAFEIIGLNDGLCRLGSGAVCAPATVVSARAALACLWIKNSAAK